MPSKTGNDSSRGQGANSTWAFPLKSWELYRGFFRPTTGALQQLSRLLAGAEEDFLVTFEFPGCGDLPEKVIYIHRSLLVSSGGALKTLVTSGFKESNSKSVTVFDSYEVWQLIRRYLYRVPVDMKQVTAETVMVAHRYELYELFCACFLWIEISGKWQGKALVEDWLEVVSLVQPPRAFCEYFALQFSINFDSVVEQLAECNWKVGTQNVWVSLFSRGMFAAIVKYITRTAAKDYSVILLDALFTDLMHEASDEDIKHILSFFDWRSAGFLNALNSDVSQKWNQRSWKALALNARETAKKGSFDVRVQCRVPLSNLRRKVTCLYEERYVSPSDKLGVVNVSVEMKYPNVYEYGTTADDFRSILVTVQIDNKHKNAQEYYVAGNIFLIRAPCRCRISEHKDFTFMESEASFCDYADNFNNTLVVADLLERPELKDENNRSCEDCVWMLGVRMRFARGGKTSDSVSPWKGCGERDEFKFSQLPQLGAHRTMVSNRREHVPLRNAHGKTRSYNTRRHNYDQEVELRSSNHGPEADIDLSKLLSLYDRDKKN